MGGERVTGQVSGFVKSKHLQGKGCGGGGVDLEKQNCADKARHFRIVGEKGENSPQ